MPEIGRGAAIRRRLVIACLRVPAIDSIAVSDRYVFWIQESNPGGVAATGKLWRARRDGSGAHPILSHVLRYGGTTVIGLWLYWIDIHGLSRVNLDGSNPRRNMIPLTLAKTDVAEGIVTDGRYLYLSRCGEGAIGRVFPDGSDLRTRFIRAGRHACPQGLGIDGRPRRQRDRRSPAERRLRARAVLPGLRRPVAVLQPRHEHRDRGPQPPRPGARRRHPPAADPDLEPEHRAARAGP